MAFDPTPLQTTGFASLDNAAKVKRAPRHYLGLRLQKDPTGQNPDAGSARLYDFDYAKPYKLEDIEKAYDVDSYVCQGVDKYVELITKHGWRLDCETPEPIEYLQRRFQLMGIMTGKPWDLLIDQLVHDYVKLGNPFLIKKRGMEEGIPGLPTQGVGGRLLPVLGYFRMDPKRLCPVWSKDRTQLLSWQYHPPAGKPISFPRGEVLHFPYNQQAGHIWGRPSLLPVLDDVRGYRQCEDYVIRLLYKHLNPLMHHEVPDNVGTGQGRQEDVDAAHAAHSVVAPDGMIITPPGHKISMIGAESRALRGEGYMQLLRQRIYSGLGVNPVTMGDGESTSAGSADAMTVVMHNRAKLMQRQLAAYFTHHIIYELLLEGGFDPLSIADHVTWVWNDMETEALLARENHALQLYMGNGITLPELRRATGRKPLNPGEEEGLYVHQVEMPMLVAQGEARAGTLTPGGAKAQVSNRANPANQHGKRGAPKIRPR